jgi:replicative DNA helicase
LAIYHSLFSSSQLEVSLRVGNNSMEHRTLPQSPEIERIMIATAILFPAAAIGAVDIVEEQDFYSPAFRRAWKEIRRQVAATGTVDQIGLLQILSDTEQSIVLDALDGTTSANIEPYCHQLRGFTALRKLIEAAQKIQALAFSPEDMAPADVVSEATQLIRAVESREIARSYRHSEIVVRDTMQELEALRQGRRGGIQTGFKDLDSLLGGIYPGELVIVGGRPGMGKTAFCVQVASHRARQGDVCLVAELEMRDRELILREMCAAAEVSMHSIRSGKMTNADYYRLAEAAGSVAELPLYIDDQPKQTVEHIYLRARRLRQQAGKLSLIVIDNFQLMRSTKRGDRYERFCELSADLKSLTKELDVPVMLVSHLGRDIERRPVKKRRPLLSDLKETGALEQDADVVLFPYRPEVYDASPENVGICEVVAAKHRNGPPATVELRFEAKLMRFTDAPTF